MAKGSTYGAAMLALVFQGKAIGSLGMSSGGTLANLWCALHRYDPSGQTQSDGGELSTSCGYTRAITTRSSAGWVVTTANPPSACPAVQINFPAITDRLQHLANYWSVGSSSSGTGQIFFSGLLQTPYSLSLGDVPALTTGSCIWEQ